MRVACLLVLMMLLSACSSQRAGRPVQAHVEPQVSEPIADARPASALAFDPRTSLGYPPLFLDREPRRTAAYWGLQGPTTTLFYQRTDDRYGAGWDDAAAGERYRRRTVEVKMGTSVR